MTQTSRKTEVFFYLLFSVFVAACTILLIFTFWGSFRLILPVNSPLNAESFASLAFIAILGLGSTGFVDRNTTPETPRNGVAYCCIVLATAAAFWSALTTPLLYDSYAHVAIARTQSLSSILTALFHHPVAGDFFFRPLGDFSYWLDVKWAGTDFTLWHLWNVCVHVTNSCLVYLLARQLAFRTLPATLASLVFSLHGSRPEVVVWVAARYDLLAALFVILTLVAINRYLDSGRARWYLAISSCTLLALLSKEAAYCLPLLVFGLILFRPGEHRKLFKIALVVTAVCVAMFVYRYWLVCGIGGYRTASGHATILQFSFLRTLKALLFRMPALLFFPINWSTGLSLGTKLALALMLAVMGAVLSFARVSPRLLAAALFWILAAALPVQHLLLIGPDLSGSRILYLPVLGFGLFWAAIAERFPPPAKTRVDFCRRAVDI
jgi:hypothetical protein